ncbi:alpha/beta hydrolase [Endozoicomonas sp. G2_1]|uniref:alpha/beta fold hydrolase n=1 Tax=Endozoicomonas sp. G2_1 TaxID=2821091 RepID=UPI001ADAA97D|nr:alpha/beta hydrolase [Endozoicomonas sp. G2_1]MBO9489118.1 alpha/beta hydrolase [Endozoicomonas sp. G2_1]
MKLISRIVTLLLVSILSFCALYWQSDRSVDELKSQWAQAPSVFIDVNGMQVHLRDQGPKSDPEPIVLIHGTSSSLHTWEGWSQALIDERRVIRFDLPGFGLTGPSPDNIYTIESYVEFIAATLAKLKVNKAILVGNSFGGYIAWATAVTHPELVTKLTLVDTSGSPFTPESMPIAFAAAKIPVVNKLMAKVTPRFAIEASVKNVYADDSKITEALIDQYYDLATVTGNRQALVERFRQAPPGPWADKIATISQPTLIIWGEQDKLIPIAIGEHFHREIANSQFVSFEHLGHIPHEEGPTETVNAFKAFLEGN